MRRNYKLEYQMANEMNIKEFIEWVTPIKKSYKVKELPRLRLLKAERIKKRFELVTKHKLSKYLDKSRERSIIIPRQVLSYVFYKNGFNPAEISQIIKQHYTTVYNSLKAVQIYIDNKDELIDDFIDFINYDFSL